MKTSNENENIENVFIKQLFWEAERLDITLEWNNVEEIKHMKI